MKLTETTPPLKLKHITLMLNDGRVVEIPIERIREVIVSNDPLGPFLGGQRLVTIVLEWNTITVHGPNTSEDKSDRGALMDANP